MWKQTRTVQTVKIERLILGTATPEKFIDELERLCQKFASVAEASQGDGFTFKFNVEA